MNFFAKSALCAAVAFAGTASADIKPLNADQFSIGGEVTAGGYYESEKGTANTGATEFTLKNSYKNGGIVGYVEVDLKAKWGQELDGTVKGLDREITSDLDKAWIGYDFGFGTLSYGVENDTALDKVDGKGDLTVEFGKSANDASDKFNVVKFQGSTQGVVYGISYFENEKSKLAADNNDRGYNGYVGYEAGVVNVYVGHEKKRNEFKTTTVTGNADLGVAKVGVNYWTEKKNNDAETTKGYYVSAAKSFGELTLAAGYSDPSNKAKHDTFFNVSGEYTLSANTYVVADVKFGKEKADTDKKRQDVYVKVGYTF
ncbi:porin [Endozoicomonas sp. OPT23]|uniref:porin n=1 Tax=Endozoicomonas sp. OPT23 TaxID=2072845 RepID=UPI00129B5F41|nr:porin [Endozoicomonas sp. OPT23]MRI35331.1 porin [Endozoicomonas sp. OPT23]